MAKCLGNHEDHCCYIRGKVCKFLRDDGKDAKRRWVCIIREKYNSWDEVHKDSDYLKYVKPDLDKRRTKDHPHRIKNCGDYPSPGIVCGACGIKG